MPFVIQVLSKITFAFTADSMKRKGWSVNMVTKLFNSIASFGCAICMLVVSLTSNGTIMLIFLCIGISLTSGYVAGYNTSIVCVAPVFAAAVSAYGQGFAQLASILAPMVIGFITRESGIDAWSRVFHVLVAVLTISGLSFQVFGSANIQSWANLGLSPLPTSSSIKKSKKSGNGKKGGNPEEQKSLVYGEHEGNTMVFVEEEEVGVGGRRPSRTRVQRVSVMDENGEVYLTGSEQQLKEPF